MNKKCLLVIVSVIVLLINGCAQKRDHVVTIKTRYGDMVAILYDETPKHKENFLKLVRAHYYDSLLFHRVIEGFMIQGGDPDSKKALKGQRLGDGGPGYTIEPEINPKFFHEKGALSAARLGDAVNPGKASSGSQFYIVQGQKQEASNLTLDVQKFQRALQQFCAKPENKIYLDSIRTFAMQRDQSGFEEYMMSLKPLVEEDLGIEVDEGETFELIVKRDIASGGRGRVLVNGSPVSVRELADTMETVRSIFAAQSG